MSSKGSFEKDCIEVHNKYRKNHGAKPLQRKDELTRHAQDWANKLAAQGELKNSNNRNYGENVAMSSSQHPTAIEITAMWYDQIAKYDFCLPGFRSSTGNFTQVVWKESTHVGIGIASGAKGTFVVANYKPAGNVTNPGYFEKNVCRVETESKRSDSSNSEENGSVFVEKLAQSGTETEIKDNTDVEEFTDEKGCRVRKTIKTTTTTTTKGNSKTTSVKKDVDIEYLNESDSSKDNLGKVFDDVICIPPGEKSSESIGSRSSSRSSNSSDEVVSKKMSGSDRKTFEDQSIKRHNELRKIHGASPLRRSGKLREKAQKWAERLLSLRRLQHSNDIEYGENVAYKFSLDRCRFEGNEIVDMWYEGLRNYDFTKAQFSSETGNFTQIVWENSTEIGVGVADDGEGTIYAVAKYYPAGNVKGLFYKNVKPPKQ